MSTSPAADRVLDVLSLLAREPEPLAGGTVAARLRLPRSTTYRLLSILVEHGYLTYLPEDRRYGLGVTAYELGSAYQRQAPLQRMARPILHQLVDRMRQNAHLAILHGRDVLYLIEERAPGRPLLITDVGVRLPAVHTASGLAILAGLPRSQVRALFPNAAAFVDSDRGPATSDRTPPTAERRAQPGLFDRGGHRHRRAVLGRPDRGRPRRLSDRGRRRHLPDRRSRPADPRRVGRRRQRGRGPVVTTARLPSAGRRELVGDGAAEVETAGTRSSRSPGSGSVRGRGR